MLKHFLSAILKLPTQSVYQLAFDLQPETGGLRLVTLARRALPECPPMGRTGQFGEQELAIPKMQATTSNPSTAGSSEYEFVTGEVVATPQRQQFDALNHQEPRRGSSDGTTSAGSAAAKSAEQTPQQAAGEASRSS